MLSKESFLRAIEGIQKHDRFVAEINDACRKYSMEFYSVNSGDIVVIALLGILAAEMDDKAGYIAWWLYDDVDKPSAGMKMTAKSLLTSLHSMLCTIFSWKNTIKGSEFS